MPLHVTFKSKAPFQDIDGEAFCLWQYEMTLDQPTSEGVVAGFDGLVSHLGLSIPGAAGGTETTTTVGEVGLGFSNLLDIKDPSQYPNVKELDGTRLAKPANSDGVQFVYIGVPKSDTATLNIYLVAPCAENPFTPITLISVNSQGRRLTPPFVAGPRTLENTAQVTIGPAEVSPHSQQAPGAMGRPGMLPYASEPFGVYQPLLGWRSALSQARLSDATAQRFVRSTRLISGAASISIERPIGNLQSPVAINRTDTAIGQHLATHVSDVTNTGLGGREWHLLLANAEESTLSSITRKVISGLQTQRTIAPAQLSTRSNQIAATAAQAPAVLSAAPQIAHEAATATLLHYLGQTAPAVITQIFQPAIADWQRVLAGAIWFTDNHPAKSAFLSPIGILHRFREYFFELGSFLGPPVGHVWLSPGGTVELIEVNTRRTLVERTVEQSTETVQKTELSQTDHDELSDAIKSENANDTKLGVTATASGGVTGVWQASGSASFNLDVSRKQAQEQTHKRMREQSSKLSSEVRQNYKTTFRTVTETTDTSSRRYVLQNTTSRLVSYELSRKMRKVAVQVQDLGQQLCWQVYIDNPGDPLGLGEFVHEAMKSTDPGSKPPDEPPPPPPIPQTFSSSVAFIDRSGDQDSNPDVSYSPNLQDGRPDHGINVPDVGTNSIIEFEFAFDAPAPPPNYQLTRIESINFKGEAAATLDGVAGPNPNPATNRFTFRLTKAHFHNQPSIPFDVVLIYTPTQAAIDKVQKASDNAKTAYNDEVARQKEQKFYETLRARLKLVGQVRPRPQDDLREEERNIVYRAIIARLYGSETGWSRDDFHVASELIRYLFDVDAMLYFVAPDWWRPRQQALVSKNSQGEIQPTIIADSPMSNRLNFSRVPKLGSYRPDYLITEETAPAPQGASLGWLIQLDGDVHRNAFLNSPWVKAVLPIRPGRERDAIAWLRRPEVADTDGLDELYPFDPKYDPPEYKGLTLQDVLLKIADRIAQEQQASLTPVPVNPKAVPMPINPELALPTETVFSHGFDPLEGGIKFAQDEKDAFKVFSQWLEVLPTDQVVATEFSLVGLKV
jgi:hypothetical protein